eukprot:2168238-Amphidinium_carterae.1
MNTCSSRLISEQPERSSCAWEPWHLASFKREHCKHIWHPEDLTLAIQLMWSAQEQIAPQRNKSDIPASLFEQTSSVGNKVPTCFRGQAAGVEQGNQSGGLEKVAPVSEVMLHSILLRLQLVGSSVYCLACSKCLKCLEVQLSTCERHTQHEELLNVAQTVLSVVQG